MKLLRCELDLQYRTSDHSVLYEATEWFQVSIGAKIYIEPLPNDYQSW